MGVFVCTKRKYRRPGHDARKTTTKQYFERLLIRAIIITHHSLLTDVIAPETADAFSQQC